MNQRPCEGWMVTVPASLELPPAEGLGAHLVLQDKTSGVCEATLGVGALLY